MEKTIAEFVKSRKKSQDTVSKENVIRFIAKLEEENKFKCKDYQKQAIVDTITRHNGTVLLAMEMGCGKSLIVAIVAYYYLITNKLPVLFIVPSNLQRNCYREFLKWTGYEATIVKKIRDLGKLLQGNSQVIITTYDIVGKLTNLKGEFFICIDEAHHIKNNGKKSLKIRDIVDEHADKLVLLTATPVMNRPSETFNYLRLMHPNFFDDRQAFTAKFCKGHYKYGKWNDRGVDEDSLELLNTLLDATMIKAFKKVVLPELPKKTRLMMTRYNKSDEVTEEMKKFVEYRDKVDSKGYRTKEEDEKIGKWKIKIWQLTCVSKPPLFMDDIRTRLDEEPDEKFIIFAHNVESVEYIAVRIPGAITLTGKDKIEYREKIFDQLADDHDKTYRVAVCTLDSCYQGLNASPGVRRVILVTLDFTPSKMFQAEDRCHRVTTVQPVTVYWCKSEGSYDDEIYRKLGYKHLLVNMIVNGQSRQEGVSLSEMFADDSMPVAGDEEEEEGGEEEAVDSFAVMQANIKRMKGAEEVTWEE